MGKDTLEDKAHRAVLGIAKHVKEIDAKLEVFLESYRFGDYYSPVSGTGYKQQAKPYRR